MQAGAYREAVSPGRADSCACIDFLQRVFREPWMDVRPPMWDATFSIVQLAPLVPKLCWGGYRLQALSYFLFVHLIPKSSWKHAT